MKSEVYSWRVSPVTKSALETQARRLGISIATLLDRITKEWMESGWSRTADEEEQTRLHSALFKAVGTIAGGNPKRSKQAKRLIRRRLKRRYGR